MKKIKNQTLIPKNSIKPKSKPNSFQNNKTHKRSKSDKSSLNNNLNNNNNYLIKNQKEVKQYYINIDQDTIFTFTNDPELKEKLKINKDKNQQRPDTPYLNCEKLNKDDLQNKKHQNNDGPKTKKSHGLLDHYQKILSIVNKFELKQESSEIFQVSNQQSTQKKTKKYTYENQQIQVKQFNEKDDLDYLKCNDQDQQTLRYDINRPSHHLSHLSLHIIEQKSKSQEDMQKSSITSLQSSQKQKSCQVKRSSQEKTVKRQLKNINFRNSKINVLISDFDEDMSTVNTLSARQLLLKNQSTVKRMLYDPILRPFIQPFKMKVDMVDVLNRRRRKIKNNY